MLAFGKYGYEVSGDYRGGTRDNLPGSGGWNRSVSTKERTDEVGQTGIGMVHDYHDGQLGLSTSIPVRLVLSW